MTRDERGAVTAETALVLPLLMVVTLAMVWMLTFGVAQMKSTDAAREAARALARGESPDRAAALAHEVVAGAEVSIVEEGDTVRVTVEAQVPSPGGLLDGINGTTHGEAVALREETSDAP
ncbi:hypothetical protein ASG90_09765 [Nocardioides sp. Soil797]|nr:hypothetical protein ASG90_09765 [Nocardioides sp. Soil797]